MNHTGVSAKGITCPIIREGDDLLPIIVDSVLAAASSTDGTHYDLYEKDIIGITESIVARSQGNYATINDIAADIEAKFGKDATLFVVNPIYSRNRFAVILRGIARAAKSVCLVMPDVDEVGNVLHNHPFTRMNYDLFYKEICESENTECHIYPDFATATEKESINPANANVITCELHDYENKKRQYTSQHVSTLADILSDKCRYGVLGSNKADEETLKLFPKHQESQILVERIRQEILERTGVNVIVCIYGDGCFKDPVGGIWEFADPVSMPAYTHAELIESTPNELKVKALADDKFKGLMGEELTKAIEKEIQEKENNLMGSMQSQGTTPRLYRDLLASLMDLVSGSGDRCTPIVLVQNYFRA